MLKLRDLPNAEACLKPVSLVEPELKPRHDNFSKLLAIGDTPLKSIFWPSCKPAVLVKRILGTFFLLPAVFFLTSPSYPGLKSRSPSTMSSSDPTKNKARSMAAGSRAQDGSVCDGNIPRRPGHGDHEEVLWGFQFTTVPKVRCSDVPVPFGIDLSAVKMKDEDLRHLSSLELLTRLSLAGPKVTDAGFKDLAGLENLAHLELEGTGITDAGVKVLTALKKLSVLRLRGAKITADGLQVLADLKKLSLTLQLAPDQITDNHKLLADRKQLSLELDLLPVQITDAALAMLRTKLRAVSLAGGQRARRAPPERRGRCR